MSKKYLVPVSSGMLMTEDEDVYNILVDAMEDGTLWAFMSQTINQFIQEKLEDKAGDMEMAEEFLSAIQSLKEDTIDIKEAILALSEFTKKTDNGLVKLQATVTSTGNNTYKETSVQENTNTEEDDFADFFDDTFDEMEENTNPLGGLSLEAIKEINKQISGK